MQKIFLKTINVFLVLLLLIYGCGKKTDPKPKSSFNIEPPKFELKITKAGILIKNKSKKYILIVYKSTDISCPKYNFLTQINPKQEYLDKNNSFGTTILYKFVNKMQGYNVFSKPAYSQTVFAIPAKIKLTNLKKIGENSFLLEFEKSPETKFILYFSNNNQKKKILKNNTLELVTDKPDTFYFTPVDKFGIKGNTVKVKIDEKYFEKIPTVRNIKIIKRKKSHIILWDTTQYKVKVIDPSGKNFIVTDVNFIEVEKCGDYKIILTNGKTNGPAVTVNPCKF